MAQDRWWTLATLAWSFLCGQPFLVQERPRAIFCHDSARNRLISNHLVKRFQLVRRAWRDRKPREKKWPREILEARRARASRPRSSRGQFFAVFFRVMHDRLGERGTTRSLAERCRILSSAYQASCWHMVQCRCPVSGGMSGHCIVSVYCPAVWTPTHHLLSRQADVPDFHVLDEHQMFSVNIKKKNVNLWGTE